jgi:hypothetical protein
VGFGWQWSMIKQQMEIRRSIVFCQPDRFAGWPANYGLWHWGEEVVSIFVVGWVGPLRGLHARDTSRPFAPVVARSFDGGATWTIDAFTGVIPTGAATLSGDEHVDHHLQVGPRLRPDQFATPKDPIDFTDPEQIVLCARTGIESGAQSWFYTSRDRAHTWNGPYRIPELGTTAMSARTDIVPLGSHEALFQLTTGKSDGTEGRTLCAWTCDGALTLHRRSWIGAEPAGWAIMPSSIRLPDGTILCARRRAERDDSRRRHWIDLYVSSDRGRNWRYLATPVPDTGPGGNPPSLVQLADGRLVLVFGYRAAPAGLRAVVSDDGGLTWSNQQILTDDIATSDMGYPKAVAMDDGSVLAVYYGNRASESERYVEAVRWRP